MKHQKGLLRPRRLGLQEWNERHWAL